MNWPESLTLIRHGQSAYNEVKEKKVALPAYQNFRKAFDAEYFLDSKAETALPDLDLGILAGAWPSARMKRLAYNAHQAIRSLGSSTCLPRNRAAIRIHGFGYIP